MKTAILHLLKENHIKLRHRAVFVYQTMNAAVEWFQLYGLTQRW